MAKSKPLTKVKGKRLLKALVAALNRGPRDNTSTALWGIVSALRGPDDSNYILKYLTTARIRHAIGLRGDGMINFSTSPGVPDGETTMSSGHFRTHVRMAIDALNYFDLMPEE